MENNISMEEIRFFCLRGLEVVSHYYDIINVNNKKVYDKYIAKRQNSNEFIQRVKYAFSFSFKAFMVAIGQGHFVDFETYKNFKKRNVEKMENDYMMQYASYIVDLGNKMPVAIKNTVDALKKNDVIMLKFYKTIIDNMDNSDVLKPFIKAILECDVNLPFSKDDWNRFFDVTKNVVSKDFDGCDYDSRIRHMFEEHMSKVNGSLSKGTKSVVR